MALTLAAATLGAAAIGGASAVYSASQQKKAAEKADAANQAAAAQRLAAQQQALQTVQQVQNPYLATGSAANSSLAARSGLTTGGAVPGTQAPAAGQPDYAGYLVANPDVAAYVQANPAEVAAKGGPEAYAAQHYQAFGQNEGRQLPTTAAPAAAEGTAAQPATPNPFAPQAWNAPTDFGAAPVMPTYGAGPGAADISSSAFESSPLFNLGLSEGQNNLNANFGARGLLRSGAAIKGALDFARENVKNNYSAFADTAIRNQGLAQSGYNADRNAGINIFAQTQNAYDNNRNFNYGQYTDQLNYNTNQYNTETDNLFRLNSSGQQAAGAVSNAATGYADAAGNIYGDQAASTGGRAAAVADANAGLGSAVAGIGQNLFRTAGTSSTRTTPLSSVPAWGVGQVSMPTPTPQRRELVY